MLSFQLRQEAQELLNAFDSAISFFEMLDAMNKGFPEIDSYIAQIGEGGDKAHGAANKLRNSLAQLPHVVSTIKIREFYSSLEEFQKNLHKAKDFALDDLESIDGISNSIDEYAKKYETFISSYSPQSAAPVIIEARKLASQLYGFKTALLFFVRNLEDGPYSVQQGELSLILSSRMRLEEFTTKLFALNELYKELCLLLNVSLTEFPLEVGKIESGSLWAKVFGESRVIKLMEELINSSASYLYRTYTNEGKIAAIPRKVEAIDSVLKLKSKLEAEGVDVDEMKEHISKSAIAISKQLNSLLEGQAKITVNNKNHSIGNELLIKQLEDKNLLQLEYQELEEE